MPMLADTQVERSKSQSGLRVDLDDRAGLSPLASAPLVVNNAATASQPRATALDVPASNDAIWRGLLASRTLKNPLFDLSLAGARREAIRLRAAPPAKLDRPVLVVAGWRAWHVAPAMLASALRSLTGGSRGDFGAFAYPLHSNFDDAARGLVHAAQRLTGTVGAPESGEVDVVGVSMGGLLARYAATKRDATGAASAGPMPRLRIGRLFTLATPHRGARISDVVRPDKAATDMRAGSAFLRSLDAQLSDADYELVCYARLGDRWVGATRTAPQGFAPIWVPEPALSLSHLLVGSDPRIMVDIARRLRGEDPIAIGGSMPPLD